ncbi:hypothetical protein [Burkholderia contaminans]|uniref:hypothetical protein n=1 Tax=Burkholderia contaminans TaxID=488447 RepID=UPI001C2EDC68|nr:hypothetical protein [Burkholderia contaminans]MCA8157821.1 hypothetical protein [Burkholderia contaminans]
MAMNEQIVPSNDLCEFEVVHLRSLVPHEWVLVGGDDGQSEYLYAADYDDRLVQSELKDNYREFER